MERQKKSKTLKIAMLGFGVVGSGFYHVVQSQKDEWERNHNLLVEVSKILVKNPDKPRNYQISGLFCDTFEDILNDDSIGIVVETMGGTTLSLKYVEQSLRRGKSVVTANKALMAQYGESLLQISRESGAFLMYEASVGGAVFMLQNLTEIAKTDSVEKIEGVLNGTCNHILTRMHQEQMSFEEALQEAKDLGYAEQDHAFDTQGRDAAQKLSILARIGFHGGFFEGDVKTSGIENVTNEDILKAEGLGEVLKLIAKAERVQDGRVILEVSVRSVPNKSLLGAVSGADNVLVVSTKHAGEFSFVGKGAGGLPTGFSVASDVLRIGALVDNG